MPPDKSQSDFCAMLNRYGVPFAVIGGHAVQFHGYLRATEDLDLLWLRTPETELRLLEALCEVQAQWISDERDPQTNLERLVDVSLPYVRSTHLMMLVTKCGFVDLFDFVPGYPDADVSEALAHSIPHGTLRYISLDWLKKMKQASGRHRDREDLERL